MSVSKSQSSSMPLEQVPTTLRPSAPGLGFSVLVQVLASSSQSSVVQTSPSPQSRWLPPQVPPVHWSFSLQYSPSSHEVPSVLFWDSQASTPSLQTPLWHSSAQALQSRAQT
jgi:hypothetical protein